VRRTRNVFDDLGFSNADATALTIKAKLHSQIVHYAQRYSQAELQGILGEPQPRVSDLLRGKVSKFSLETLINYADALHMRPEIRTHKPVTVAAAS
jgi:predicted XRE-type DNA-binding protein